MVIAARQTLFKPGIKQIEYVEKNFNTDFYNVDLFDLSMYLDQIPTFMDFNFIKCIYAFDKNISSGTRYAYNGLYTSAANRCLIGGYFSPTLFRIAIFTQTLFAQGPIDIEANCFYEHQLTQYVDGSIIVTVDGNQVYTRTRPSTWETTAPTNIYVMHGSSKDDYSMRLKRFAIGDIIDCVPVIYKSQIALYNFIDGNIFVQQYTDGIIAGPAI